MAQDTTDTQTPDTESDADKSLKQKFGLGAIALLTPLLGGILGGSQGALAGGSAGLGAVGGGINSQNKIDREKEKEAQAIKFEQDKRKSDLEDFKTKQEIIAENKPAPAPPKPKTYSVGGQIVQEDDAGAFKPVYTAPKAGAGAPDAKDLDKMRKALETDLDANKARGGNLAKSQDLVNQADRLKTLVSSVPDGNLDQRQQEELAIGLNRLLSGSSASASAQVKALVPASAIGNAQKLKEWLFNEPTGVNQQAFVSRMTDTIDRERSVAQKKVVDAQVQRLAAHKLLREQDPDTYNEILMGYGIDPSKIDKNGHYQETENLSPEDTQAIEWAKANPKDPRSQKILELHGVK